MKKMIVKLTKKVFQLKEWEKPYMMRSEHLLKMAAKKFLLLNVYAKKQKIRLMNLAGLPTEGNCVSI